jgi:hypothetical protein
MQPATKQRKSTMTAEEHDIAYLQMLRAFHTEADRLGIDIVVVTRDAAHPSLEPGHDMLGIYASLPAEVVADILEAQLQYLRPAGGKLHRRLHVPGWTELPQ